MRKSKKEIGALLLHKTSNRNCIIISFDDKNFTVEFDSGENKTYSLGSLESKFSLYNKEDEVYNISRNDNRLVSKQSIEQNTAKYKKLEEENQELKLRIEKLETIINIPKPKHAGGRPAKFTIEQMDKMKELIRNEKKTYREVANMFKCSATYVFKINKII